MLVPKCIYPKSIFAKCTRLACLLSFASLFTFRSRPRAPEFLRKGAREERRSRSKAVRTVREEVEEEVDEERKEEVLEEKEA